MAENIPKIGFEAPPHISRQRAIEFLVERIRKVTLLTINPGPAARSCYVPRRAIVSRPAGPITEAQAAGLLADETTTMPLELVKLPDNFVEGLRNSIPPRGGKPLPDVHGYKPLLRDAEGNVLLRGVPLECREDKPGTGFEGSLDTSMQMANGEYAKVGWHYDAKDPAERVEYAIINGATGDQATDREFGFAPGINRAAFGEGLWTPQVHAKVAGCIQDWNTAAITAGAACFTALAIRLRPAEALLRVRPREVLHDGIPNILGSTAIMLSMDPATPLHQFDASPWEARAEDPLAS